MASSALSSFGTLLKRNGTTIAEVMDIKGPGLSLDTEDVTSHDSTAGWVERIGTLLDAGEVSFDINWLPANATQSYSAGLVSDMVARTKQSFSLVVPAASTLTWSFTALVTKFEPDLKVKGAQRASVTLQLTGQPTLA